MRTFDIAVHNEWVYALSVSVEIELKIERQGCENV